jgi:signal peptidase
MNKKTTAQGIGILAAIAIAVCVMPGLIAGTTQILTVMSDSMSPDINAGDMVIIKAIDPAEIEVGDIVTYAPRMYGVVITHRVIDIDETGNYVTKGDANAKKDISTVKPEQIIGRCEMTIPYLGYLALPAILLLGMEIKNIVTCKNG